MLNRYKKTDNYYTDLAELPLYNWFKIQQTGDLRYLFKDYNSEDKTPEYFDQLLLNLIEQFDKLDNTLLRLKAQKLYLESKYLTTGKSAFKMESVALDDKIKNIGENTLTIEDFINYIEITFKQLGSIDAKKISTKRAYSLYYKALEANNRKLKQHGTD